MPIYHQSTVDPTAPHPDDDSRRSFMKQAGGILDFTLAGAAKRLTAHGQALEGAISYVLQINAREYPVCLKPQVTLLQALHESAYGKINK